MQHVFFTTQFKIIIMMIKVIRKRKMTDSTKIRHYTNSIYYNLELTARYCKVLGAQLFEKIYPDFSADEFSTLDTIYCNPGICQRDLAKLLFKDRANTGRILDSLEKKALIERYNDTKNNRLVRKMKICDAGLKVLEEVTKKLQPSYEFIYNAIPETEMETMKNSLKKLRENVAKIVEMQI